MNLTTQLRIILLLVGAAIWLGIYLLGKRRALQRASIDTSDFDESPPETTGSFTSDELDEEELDTPAYMRRQGQREARQDYEPRIANVDDYAGNDANRDGNQQLVDIAVHDTRREMAADHITSMPEGDHEHTSYAEPVYDEPPGIETAVPAFAVRHEPRVSLDDSFAVSAMSEPHVSEAAVPDFEATAAVHVAAPEPVSAASIPVMADPVASPYQTTARAERHDTPAVTPTVSDVVRAPAQPPEYPAQPAAMSKSPASPAARRKIIALRLPMPERVPGSQLLALLQREQLQHGKFSIFHRMHESQSVFSVASMVEPGTFEPSTMAEQQFPGVTLFMLLPGPLDGLVAYDQMMSCAQRLAHATGGTLQDERGSKLTTQSMDRLRDEVLDFQHLIGGVATAH